MVLPWSTWALIGRRLRELNVYCEIHPFNRIPALDDSVRGVVLSGSPWSVRDPKAPSPDLSGIKGRFPMLCICYGAQYIAHRYGGEVNPSIAREYGRAIMHIKEQCPLTMPPVRGHSLRLAGLDVPR